MDIKCEFEMRLSINSTIHVDTKSKPGASESWPHLAKNRKCISMTSWNISGKSNFDIESITCEPLRTRYPIDFPSNASLPVHYNPPDHLRSAVPRPVHWILISFLNNYDHVVILIHFRFPEKNAIHKFYRESRYVHLFSIHYSFEAAWFLVTGHCWWVRKKGGGENDVSKIQSKRPKLRFEASNSMNSIMIIWRAMTQHLVVVVVIDDRSLGR